MVGVGKDHLQRSGREGVWHIRQLIHKATDIKKEKYFTWATCANCVEIKEVGIKRNPMIISGNSPLPAIFQAERSKHAYKLLSMKQTLNEEKAEDKGIICSCRKEKHRNRTGRKK